MEGCLDGMVENMIPGLCTLAFGLCTSIFALSALYLALVLGALYFWTIDLSVK